MTNTDQSNHAATSPTNSEAVRSGDWLGDNGQEPSVDRTSDAARSGVGGEEDWRDSPEYQAFLEACAKECRCTHSICDGVLAGGLCDEIIEDDRDEDNYPREEDDEY